MTSESVIVDLDNSASDPARRAARGSRQRKWLAEMASHEGLDYDYESCFDRHPATTIKRIYAFADTLRGLGYRVVENQRLSILRVDLHDLDIDRGLAFQVLRKVNSQEPERRLPALEVLSTLQLKTILAACEVMPNLLSRWWLEPEPLIALSHSTNADGIIELLAQLDRLSGWPSRYREELIWKALLLAKKEPRAVEVATALADGWAGDLDDLIEAALAVVH